MSVEHKNLTGASLHEPKGVAGAGAETAYIADGAGSGAWQDPLASVNNKNLLIYNKDFTNLSTASSVYIPIPLPAKVVKVTIVSDAVFTGTNTVTAQIVPGGSSTGAPVGAPMSMALTGALVNTISSAVVSSNNTLAVTDSLRIISDGAGTNTCTATITVTLDVS